MKTSVFIIAFLTIASICASCSKVGYEELKGRWIEQAMDTTIYENGRKTHFLSYYEFNFKEDFVVKTFVVKCNGECVLEISCKGSWDYIKGPFESGSQKKGMIQFIYDLDTFVVEYDKLNEPTLIDNIRESLIVNNKTLEKITKEESNIHYGYSILGMYPNYIEFESKDSGIIYWTRVEAYDNM